MTLLFIAAYDSMNHVLAACAQEALRRNHSVIVVVSSLKDSRNNKMFFNRGIQVIPVDKLDCRLLDCVDMAVAAPVRMAGFNRLFAEVRKRHIFMVSFASLFSSVVMREYPDLVLCLGTDKFREFRENYLKYNMIAVGNPQYDPLVKKRKETGSPIRKVLIIDQGGYPYGTKGKCQLADTIMSIASFHPEKEFYIKPRYGNNDEGRMTHGMSGQLSDYINKNVSNLHMLDGAGILEDILPEYDAVITTWSTAYIAAVMLNIPLILIEGLDSMDVFDVRNERVDAAYEHLRRTGCLHDYRCLQSRKVEFRYVDKAYIEEEISSWDEPCGEKVLQLLEFINDKVLKQGMRIAEHFETDLEGFYSSFSRLKLVPETDSADRKRRSYLSEFNGMMQEWVYLNRCMGRIMDMTFLYRLFDMRFSEADDTESIRRLLEHIKEQFAELKSECFSAEDITCRVQQDPVLQDFYFDWLYETKQFDKLDNYSGTLAVPESRLYNMALSELDRKNYRQAYSYLEQFMALLRKNDDRPVQLLKEKRLLKGLLPFCRGRNMGRFICFVLKPANRRQVVGIIRENTRGMSAAGACRLIMKNKLG